MLVKKNDLTDHQSWTIDDDTCLTRFVYLEIGGLTTRIGAICGPFKDGTIYIFPAWLADNLLRALAKGAEVSITTEWKKDAI